MKVEGTSRERRGRNGWRKRDEERQSGRERDRERIASYRERERGGRKRRKQTSDREVQRGMQEEYTDKETKM